MILPLCGTGFYFRDSWLRERVDRENGNPSGCRVDLDLQTLVGKFEPRAAAGRQNSNKIRSTLGISSLSTRDLAIVQMRL